MAALAGALNLDRVVVSKAGGDLSDPDNIVVSGSAGGVGGGAGRTDQAGMAGDFRAYANGTTRLILGTATARTQSLALRALTPSQVEAVLALTGKVVCFRDTYGRKVFGAYLVTSRSEIPLSGRWSTGTLLTDIGLTIQSVTWDEEV